MLNGTSDIRTYIGAGVAFVVALVSLACGFRWSRRLRGEDRVTRGTLHAILVREGKEGDRD